MDAIHDICARVRIVYRDGTFRTPTWNNKQIDEIVRRSPVFEGHINRLLLLNEYVWKIEPRETDGFDDLAVHFLIDNLGRHEANEVWNGIGVESLSEKCSAMWYFEVVPSRFNVASHVTDADGKVIADNAAPTILAGESAGWCWNCVSIHRSPETSLKLANIALVLGWREVFRREIKTVIWDWTEQTLAGTKTRVECLQNNGVRGLDSMSPQN